MPAASPGYDARLVNGDLPTAGGGLITGTPLTLQRLPRRLLLFRGEVLSNRFAGIPWNELLSTSPPDVGLIEGYVRAAIDTCPGVASCGEIVSDFDIATRHLIMKATVTLVTGETVILPLSPGNNGNPALVTQLLTPQAMMQ